MAAMDVDCRHLIKVLIISLLGFERVWLECRVVSKDRSRQWNRPAHRVLQTSSFVANARPILACFSKKAQAKSSYFAKVPLRLETRYRAASARTSSFLTGARTAVAKRIAIRRRNHQPMPALSCEFSERNIHEERS
jgi:hypothetical protein